MEDGKVSPKIPEHIISVARPPPVPTLSLAGKYPGSPEWNDCIRSHNEKVAEHQRKMRDYFRSKLAVTEEEATQAGVSILNSGDVDIMTNMDGISVKSYLGQYYIGARLAGAEVNTLERSGLLRFETEDDTTKRKKWLVISPPGNVQLNSIQHQLDGNNLNIHVNQGRTYFTNQFYKCFQRSK